MFCIYRDKNYEIDQIEIDEMESEDTENTSATANTVDSKVVSKGGRPQIPYSQNKITQKQLKIEPLKRQLADFCKKEDIPMYELLGNLGKWYYNQNQQKDPTKANMFGKISKGENPFTDELPADR